MHSRSSKTISYRVDAADRITDVSENWDQFAFDNGASELRSETILGTFLFDWITNAEVVALYQVMLSKVRSERTLITFPFRCDSADCRRFMKMTMAASDNDCIVFESECLITEQRKPIRFWDRNAERSNMVVLVCSWCKKIFADDRWLEIDEALLTTRMFDHDPLPMISHGICPPCLEATSPAST